MSATNYENQFTFVDVTSEDNESCFETVYETLWCINCLIGLIVDLVTAKRW